MEARRTKYLKKGFVITVLYPSNQPESGKSSVCKSQVRSYRKQRIPTFENAADVEN